MNTRRPSHAAGESWRKWEDPLMYGSFRYHDEPEVPWATAIAFWLACIDVVIWIAVVATWTGAL